MSFVENVNFTLGDGTPVTVIPIPGYYKLVFKFDKNFKELIWPVNLCIIEAKNFEVLETYEFEGLKILLGLLKAKQI